MTIPTSGPGLEIADLRSQHVIAELPILVIMPHSRCNCRCVMCDIWRIRQIREITASDLQPHLEAFRSLKVRWVVFSGGEPLMHSDLYELARLLRNEGIRMTLLTAGLTLARHASDVASLIDDVIVSLDGPRETHDQVRGVPEAFRRLEQGILALRHCRPSISIHGRCTVQRANFQYLRATAQAARELELNSLSFLAADISSAAFNHSQPLERGSAARIALDVSDVESLATEIDGLIDDSMSRLPRDFIRESPAKLYRIVSHFRAQLGQTTLTAPRCNAPWVSAVIESDGSVRPCFFHPPLGNLNTGSFIEIVNSAAAVQFRSKLDMANNPVCQKCVCSLHLKPRLSSSEWLPTQQELPAPAPGTNSN